MGQVLAGDEHLHPARLAVGQECPHHSPRPPVASEFLDQCLARDALAELAGLAELRPVVYLPAIVRAHVRELARAADGDGPAAESERVARADLAVLEQP